MKRGQGGRGVARLLVLDKEEEEEEKGAATLAHLLKEEEEEGVERRVSNTDLKMSRSC